MTPQQRLAVLGYVAGGLGVLDFIWGFLDWTSVGNGLGGSAGIAGFATAGTGAIVATLLAGLLALAEGLEKKTPSMLPAAAAVAGLLVTFGIMVSTPDGYDVAVGLILALITAIAQTGVLIFACLTASGRLAQRPGQHSPGTPPGSGPPPGYGPPPGGYGGPPPGYGPPPQ
jgi:hypothetical protein